MATKRERREGARQERLALQRRMARRRRLRQLAIRTIAPVVVILAVLAAYSFLGRHRSPTTPPKLVSGPVIDPATRPGILTGPAPWPPNTADLRARLDAIGLPALPAESFVLHIHQHIDVFVDGRPITVPALIGINQQEQFLSPIHTHTPDGIVHVESPTRRTFSLGQFFDVWGVRFTQTCLGGYCAGSGKSLRVYVDGHLVAGDPRRVELFAHEEIVVAYGTAAELPNPIPSSYTFPAKL